MKINQRIRHKMVYLVIKNLTPLIYKKLVLLELISGDNIIRRKHMGVSMIPRPSIIMMKKRFNGKKVIGAEIGVQRGVNSGSILKELKIEKLYLIDIWNDTWDDYGKKDSLNYQVVLKRFSNNKRIQVIKDFSKNAVKNINDDSLDFVYIDANHDYNHVYQDIELWTPKIKRGGVIAGHDVFNFSDVLEAVKDYCSKNKIIFHIELPDWYFIKHNKGSE